MKIYMVSLLHRATINKRLRKFPPTSIAADQISDEHNCPRGRPLVFPSFVTPPLLIFLSSLSRQVLLHIVRENPCSNLQELRRKLFFVILPIICKNTSEGIDLRFLKLLTTSEIIRTSVNSTEWKIICLLHDFHKRKTGLLFFGRWRATVSYTSSSAIAEGPRDALRQLKSCQLLHNCTKNRIWLEGLPFHVV